MRNTQALLTQYARYHRDPRNIATHFVGVPLIVLAVGVLLARASIDLGGWTVSAAWLAWAASTVWYLSRGHLGAGATVSAAIAGLMVLAHPLATGSTASWLAWGLGLFGVGWVIQFVGHYYEGRKPAFVDDLTPLSPKMIYGAHKAMMEHAVALLSNRGMIEGVTVRLPGILARPKGPSGMKSAFMSNLFHALKAGEAFTCPVSAQGTIWAQSVARCAENFLHAVTLDTALLPPTRAVTLPALRVGMGDLADSIARQCGVSPDLVRYEPDAALEAAFAAQPPLATSAAEKAGFAHDGNLDTLVQSALETL
jgi:uncharacterized membrane protein YGL010W